MWSLLQVPEPSFFEWIAKVLLLQIQLFLLPSLACILFFFFLSLLYGFFSFVYFKQKLSEKKYKKLALVLLGILFFVVLPILEVQLSFMFAMQRNVGKLLDTYHEPLLEWSLSLGESLIRQAMGKELEQETLIELGSLREILKRESDALLDLRETKNPIQLLFSFPQIVLGSYIYSLEQTLLNLEKETSQITWGTLLGKSKNILEAEGQKLFKRQAQKFYFTSWIYLFFALLLFVLSSVFIKKGIQRLPTLPVLPPQNTP